MSKPIFFLDMDGVLSDFVTGLARLFQRKADDLPRCYCVATCLGLSFAEVDRRIQSSPGFWAQLPVFPWAQELVTRLSTKGEVYILSMPWPGQPACAMEKMIWLDRKLKFPLDRVILTPHKHLLAGPNRILIDDHDKNCKAWCKAGSVALEFPARHNEFDTLYEAGLRNPTFLLDHVDGVVERAIAEARSLVTA